MIHEKTNEKTVKKHARIIRANRRSAISRWGWYRESRNTKPLTTGLSSPSKLIRRTEMQYKRIEPSIFRTGGILVAAKKPKTIR